MNMKKVPVYIWFRSDMLRMEFNLHIKKGCYTNYPIYKRTRLDRKMSFDLGGKIYKVIR